MAEPYVVCAGLATLDTVFAVTGHPPQGGRVFASELVIAGGGPAATAAVTLARLGIETFFVGAIGNDEVGTTIQEGLEREGVDTSALEVVPGARSAQSTILVDAATGERTIVAYLGTVPALELGEYACDLCRDATWVHTDHVGFDALRLLRHDVRLSLDGGVRVEGLQLDGVALYAPTEEAIREEFPRSTLEDSIEAALAAGAELVAVTRGAEGSVGAAADGRLVHAPALTVDVVSTLGAGDVFHGALVAELVRGEPLPAALAAANACAAYSCRALDGRSAIPTQAELA